ncbi:hypothetical protein C0989_009565 [Termitomyces sp. Mn162]|nr:hypothetical protein C0989_009565 [Termitomyces sp. Mn162]
MSSWARRRLNSIDLRAVFGPIRELVCMEYSSACDRFFEILGLARIEWRLNVRHVKDDGARAHWRVVYAFSEKEFFAADFESANFAVCYMPGGFFYDKVVASRHFWLDEEACTTSDARLVGRFGMEGAVIRRHVGNRTEVVRTVTTEAERVEALGEFFGIDIPLEAVGYIHGRASALGT